MRGVAGAASLAIATLFFDMDARSQEEPPVAPPTDPPPPPPPAPPAPGAAAGAAPDGVRPSVGGRFAFALPVAQGTYALGLDLGIRTDHVYVGAYGFYVIPSDDECIAGRNCERWHGGVDVHYHLAPTRTVDPWIGAGIGGGTLGAERDFEHGGTVRRPVAAIEIGPQLGIDVKPWRRFAVGPFLMPLLLLPLKSSDGYPTPGAAGVFMVGVRAELDCTTQ